MLVDPRVRGEGDVGYLVRGDAVVVGEVQRQTIVPKTEVTPDLEGISLLPE